MSMLRAALLTAAALSLATPAFAQKACEAGATGVTANQYVEARRPVIVKRKLTSEERAEANKLASQIKSNLKSKTKPDHAALDRLAVLASSGDRDLMKVVMEGNMDTGPVQVIDLEGAETWTVRSKLAGLWAIHLWGEGDRSKPVSKALAGCVGQDNYGTHGKKTDCGFTASVAFDGKSTFNGHWNGQTGVPKSATFTEVTLLETPEQEVARYQKALAEYRNSHYDNAEHNWAACWAGLKGGAIWAEWNGTEGLSSANYATVELNKQLRKQAEIDEKAALWTALQTQRVQAKAAGGALSETDEGKWASLSFWLGGKYLLPYASETVLLQETAIDSLCRADDGKVCQRQKQLFQYRVEAGRSEQNMKEAALRNMTLGGGDVTVRNYDQNGNYLGTTTMPAWQADIAGAN
jgi:hypothetical protein